MAVQVKGMKTWSGLAKKRRRPSEYEVVTTNLQTRTRHPDQAYELSPAPLLGMNEFYKRHVSESPLQHPDWEGFRDPDEMIYRVYTRIQDQQEQYVDGLLDEHNEIGHDATLSAAWLDVLERLYTPRRFLQMALQMGAAYLVQMAPASTITACAGFQDGDEFRWLSRCAYRARELQRTHPERGFGETERRTWEEEPAWQGFRELLEKTLATYDWGEHFVALNLVAKPAADEAHRQLGRVGRRCDDGLLGADGRQPDSGQRTLTPLERRARRVLARERGQRRGSSGLDREVDAARAPGGLGLLRRPAGAGRCGRSRARRGRGIPPEPRPRRLTCFSHHGIIVRSGACQKAG